MATLASKLVTMADTPGKGTSVPATSAGVSGVHPGGRAGAGAFAIGGLAGG